MCRLKKPTPRPTAGCPSAGSACLKTSGLCRGVKRRFDPNVPLPLPSFHFRGEPADSDNAFKA